LGGETLITAPLSDAQGAEAKLSDIKFDRDVIMKRVKVIAFTLAFTFVLLAFTAQPVAAASRYDSLRSYMDSRYDAVRGGYSIPDEDLVRLDPTYGAITIMNEVGILANRPPPVTVTLVMNFVKLQQYLTGDEQEQPKYGGFSDYLLGPVTNGGNYRGLVLWQMLKSQSDVPGTGDYEINATANLLWINKTSTVSGGYAVSRDALDAGAGPDLLSTAYALSSFKILNSMYPEENAWDWLFNETATREWIDSCREGDGYKLYPDAYLPSVTGTAAAIIAYYALDSLSSIPDIGDVESWLLARQVLSDGESEFAGGFEEGNGTGVSSLESTYFALTALEVLTALPSVNTTAAEAFILSCQTPEGSFANAPGFSTGKLLYAGYACEMLNIAGFDGALNTLSSSVDPYSPGDTGFEWRLYIIVGIVLIAIVLAVLGVRAD
jgi:prenyltransferase beta subunit